MNKQEYRDRYREIRKAEENRTEKSARICGRIRESDLYKKARSIGLYSAIGSEVSLFPLEEFCRRDGKQTVYPVCVTEDGKEILRFCQADSKNLSAGSFGILEPGPACPEIKIDAIDLLLVPGLVFDLEGNRIGYGKGYYDRALSREFRGIACGVAFCSQIVPRLPAEPFDRKLHCLVTEEGIRRL